MNHWKFYTWLFLVLLAAVSFLTNVAASAGAQISYQPAAVQQPSQSPSGDSQLPPGEGPWVVRAYFTDPAIIRLVTATREPWEVNSKEGYLVMEVDKAGYLELLQAGFVVQVDEKLTALLNQPAVMLPGQTEGIPAYPCYRTVEETFASAASIASAYPTLATWLDIGDSWEKTAPGGSPGYDMMLLRLSNNLVPGPKPKLFVMSSIHAREYAPAELNTRFAEYLVSQYNTNPDITWLLDYHEIHLLLHSNPDGRKKAETGLLWRKNTNNNYCANTNSRGADLNRNFDFQWGCCGGSSSNPCDETYRGIGPGSEPEVQAVQNYITGIFPDQRPDDLVTPAPATATGLFMDIHSYGQLVLWPWGFTTSTPAPNSTALTTLGRRFAYYNDYDASQIISYLVDGATDDYAYGRLGVAGYTFELGTAFFQDCASFENTIYPENLQALVYAAKIAGTPYLTPSGPDSLAVQAAPTGVVTGEVLTVTAQVDDTRVVSGEPTQNIAAAEFSIDLPFWISGAVTQTLTAVDGVFDSKSEAVTGRIATNGLTHGRHTVFVRGKDASGRWGPVSAQFFYVLDPAIAPRFYGYVRDASNNAPLAATVRAGGFTVLANPATGFYDMRLLSGTYDVTASAAAHTPETEPGMVAQDFQSTRQDFYLSPVCPVFEDDVEGGNIGWSAAAPWAITTETAHSPTHSWTESPGGSYTNGRNTSLTSPVLDLSGAVGTTFSFWHRYDLEAGYDYGNVEFSTNGGATWVLAARYTGLNQTNWRQETLPLPALDGAASARLRLRFTSDSSITADGWHVDDLAVTAGGAGCISPLAPTAGFSSNSPVTFGASANFTNLTTGSTPLTYLWNFGDGIGASTEFEPQYTYPVTGTYTVTLTVSNTLGSDSFEQAVVVAPFTPIASIYLAQVYTSTVYKGDVVPFFTGLAPVSASPPYSYTVDFGDGSETAHGSSSANPILFEHIFAAPGSYRVEAAVQNGAGLPALTDAVTVTVEARHALALTPLAQALSANPGAVVTYTLQLQNLGDTADIFGLSLAGAAWPAGLSSTSVGPLAPGAEALLYAAVTVPAGASGGESDSLTVSAVSSYPGVAPVTATLTTTANSYYHFDLATPQAAASALPGETVTYTLQVTNSGNINDGYNIALNGVTWPSSAPAATPDLAPGSSSTFAVRVSVPDSAVSGSFDELQVRLGSKSSPAVVETQNLTTTAAASYGLGLSPQTSLVSGPAGGSGQHSLQVSNLGNSAQTFTVTLSLGGWSAAAPASLSLPAFGSAQLLVLVDIPAGAPAGAQDETLVTVASPQPGLPPVTATLTTQVEPTYQVTIAVQDADIDVWGEGTVKYNLTITNTGNVTDSYTTTITSGWSASVAGPLGPLAPGESLTFEALVSAPAGVPYGAVDEAMVTITSQGSPAKSWEAHLATTNITRRLYLPLTLR